MNIPEVFQRSPRYLKKKIKKIKKLKKTKTKLRKKK
tara:strand:+ start:485 stop:592 length:108 start_codon:yes stop_codon:yes gene_type:complete